MATTLHVAMFPWLAMGHITPFLYLSNKLAEKGIRVSILLPAKTQTRLNHLNHHPHLIQFIPIAIPQLQGLPEGAETTSDVPMSKTGLILKALDLTKDQVTLALQSLKPGVILFDLAYWIPSLAHELGIKSIYYSVYSAAYLGYVHDPSRKLEDGQSFSAIAFMNPPPGFPHGALMQHLPFEVQYARYMFEVFEDGMPLFDRVCTSIRESNATCKRTCSEIEGPIVEYIEARHNKKVLLLGPYLPEPLNTPLEDTWAKWLGNFEKGSVVYCGFGSEGRFVKDQFQELVLGLELSGFPFFARLKPPMGFETVEEALPEGFEERVRGRGVVHGGWVQQPHILRHPSIGCSLGHCGWGSMWESLITHAQLVCLPILGDQIENAKLVNKVLKISMDVERNEEDGRFTKESVAKAIKLVMDGESKIGNEVRTNRNKFRNLLLSKDLESSYLNDFVTKLKEIVVGNT